MIFSKSGEQNFKYIFFRYPPPPRSKIDEFVRNAQKEAKTNFEGQLEGYLRSTEILFLYFERDSIHRLNRNLHFVN